MNNKDNKYNTIYNVIYKIRHNEGYRSGMSQYKIRNELLQRLENDLDDRIMDLSNLWYRKLWT